MKTWSKMCNKQSRATQLAIGILVIVISNNALSQTELFSVLPDNAYRHAYGTGWDCQRGFRRNSKILKVYYIFSENERHAIGFYDRSHGI